MPNMPKVRHKMARTQPQQLPADAAAPGSHVFENSSYIHSCRHVEGCMEVLFHSGRSYSYKDVPAPLYEAMLVAESPGKFFNAKIKNMFERKE